MGENQIGDGELGKAISNQADQIQVLMLEKLRCEIKWALRTLEKEIDESGGVILIKMETLHDSPKIQLKDFTDEILIEKIQAIAKTTKL